MPIGQVVTLLPKLKGGKIVEKPELVDFIVEHGGMVESDVAGMMAEQKNSLFHYLRSGRPVRMEGVGLFSVSIRLDGSIKINFRPDKVLLERLNASDGYTGEILNTENIGKTLAELEAMVTP